MQQKIENIRSNWSKLDFNKKVYVGGAVAVAIGLSSFGVTQLTQPQYRTMMTDLTPQTVESIIPVLEAEQIPFKLSNNGEILLVDNSYHEQANIAIARSGLKSSTVSGYDHLNNTGSPYQTKSAEEQLSRRVLEENIAMAIQGIESVQSAQVRLAMSRNSQFLRDVEPSTASIVVEVKKGAQLTKGSIEAITRIAANSVPNLAVEDIVVVDNTGKLLSGSGGGIGENADTANEHKTKVESDLKFKILSIIGPIFGADNVRISVDAEIDYSQQERTEERPLETTVILSQQKDMTFDQSLSGGQGVPGALSNQPPGHAGFEENSAGATQAEQDQGIKHKKVITNYSVGKSITHTIMPVGKVTGLSVAVLVDSASISEGTDLKALELLVASSAGLNTENGDSLVLQAQAFKAQVETTENETSFFDSPLFWTAIEYLKRAFGFLIVYLLIFRPMFNLLSSALTGSKEGENNEESNNNSTESIVENTGTNVRSQEIEVDPYQREMEAANYILDHHVDSAQKVAELWANGENIEGLGTAEDRENDSPEQNTEGNEKK
ncbi:TPA: flagellar M-ring protein FliF [Vibrio vulnificus]|uniref:Flagellar M-ring protein n=1 Tax=Vibrio vulnificus TaxID=672 RepID=A0A8H9N189_VIBVL|nr:flagellar M-ring protein FliF [Vibrio vulnificus]HAS8540946.1 flagellar M-ring protein FliF [Vibrio vulnificus]